MNLVLRLVLSCFTFCSLSTLLTAQSISVTPVSPTIEDTLHIVFDTRTGNAALEDHQGPIYLHTGLITGRPENPGDWQYVQGEWGKDDPRVRMQRIGRYRYQIRFHIRSFYQLPANTDFLQISFVFRNQNGSLIAQTRAGEDFYYPQLTVLMHGPIEKADGRNGLGFQGFTGIRQKADGSIDILGASQCIRLRQFGPDMLSISYLPFLQDIPPSKAVVLPPKPLPLVKQLDGVYTFPLGTTFSIEFEIRPYRLRIMQGERVIFSDEKAFFFTPAGPKIGAITGSRMILQPNEAIWGLGSRAINMDRRGERLYGWNLFRQTYSFGETSLALSIPFLISSNGYGMFVDSWRKSYFEVGKREKAVMEIGTLDSAITYYLIPGKTQAEIVEKYTMLTGRQPMPPRWALGYLQSRQTYQNQNEALNIVRRSLQAKLEPDAIFLGADWFGGIDKSGELRWDFRDFPNPRQMIGQLQAKDIQTVLLTDPYMNRNSQAFKMAAREKLLTSQANGQPYLLRDFRKQATALMDVFHPDAREWLFNRHQPLMEQKIAGFWTEASNPPKHPSGMLHYTGAANQVHNLYAFQWAAHLYHNHQRSFPNQRFFHMLGSGYAGMQRYAPILRSGQTEKSWSAMRAQLPILLGTGLSGFGYIHSDIGGFSGGRFDSELYRRWIQFGVFSPIMRIHGQAESMQPEPVFQDAFSQKIAREAIRLRATMIPYTYTLSWQNSQKGWPLARPMNFHSNDPGAEAYMDSQYFWGEDFLVAPVLEKEQTEKVVYFPPGEWIDFANDHVFSGPNARSILLEENHIPTFVRAGSIVPMLAAASTEKAANYSGEELAFHCYLHPQHLKGSGEYYFDDGKTLLHKTDAFFIHGRLQYELKGNTLSISFSEPHHEYYPVLRETEIIVHGLGKGPKKIKISGEGLSAPSSENRKGKGFQWDPEKSLLKVPIIWTRGEGTVVIKGIKLK
ncbi:MAG: TIM-barrel domain-containing protein [Bacteroidota bacterium]